MSTDSVTHVSQVSSDISRWDHTLSNVTNGWVFSGVALTAELPKTRRTPSSSGSIPSSRYAFHIPLVSLAGSLAPVFSSSPSTATASRTIAVCGTRGDDDRRSTAGISTDEARGGTTI